MSGLERRIDFSLVGRAESALPTLATPPTRPAWPVRAPVAGTGLFALVSLVSMAFVPLSGPLAVPVYLCSVVILSAFWFFMSLALALVWREWRYGNMLHEWERAAVAELGSPYDRWRVYAREREHGVEISTVRYIPQHAPGEIPLYRAELVRSEEFGPEDEIAALERLSEWQESASEHEEAAADSYESKQQLARSTGALASRLQDQLPRRAVDAGPR